MFSPAARYAIIPFGLFFGFLAPIPFYLLDRLFPGSVFEYINRPIILSFAGILSSEISSAMLSTFVVGFASQFWLRRNKPEWFIKYNYIVAAALDSGTEVLVFILTFTVFGGVGPDVTFPKFRGNNVGGNLDYCLRDPRTLSRH